jgi:hypothetical protein
MRVKLEQQRVFQPVCLEIIAAIQQAFPVGHPLHTSFRWIGEKVHHLLTTTPRLGPNAEIVDCLTQMFPDTDKKKETWGPKDYADYIENEAVKRHRGRVKGLGIPDLQAGKLIETLVSLLFPYKLTLQPMAIAGSSAATSAAATATATIPARGVLPGGCYSSLLPIWSAPPSLDPDVLDQLFSSSSTASSGYVLPPWR